MEVFTQFSFTLLHSEWPKVYGVLAVLSAVGANLVDTKVLMRGHTIYLYPRHTKYAMGVYSFRLFCVCVCACLLTIFVSTP